MYIYMQIYLYTNLVRSRSMPGRGGTVIELDIKLSCCTPSRRRVIIYMYTRERRESCRYEGVKKAVILVTRGQGESLSPFAETTAIDTKDQESWKAMLARLTASEIIKSLNN